MRFSLEAVAALANVTLTAAERATLQPVVAALLAGDAEAAVAAVRIPVAAPVVRGSQESIAVLLLMYTRACAARAAYAAVVNAAAIRGRRVHAVMDARKAAASAHTFALWQLKQAVVVACYACGADAVTAVLALAPPRQPRPAPPGSAA
jgi:hypothetical protein